MDEFVSNIRKLGGLHDSRVRMVSWDSGRAMLSLGFDDVFSNFFGLDEYPGPLYGEIIFFGVSDFNPGLFEQKDFLNVYDVIVVTDKTGSVHFNIKCWPSGDVKISCAKVASLISEWISVLTKSEGN